MAVQYKKLHMSSTSFFTVFQSHQDDEIKIASCSGTLKSLSYPGFSRCHKNIGQERHRKVCKSLDFGTKFSLDLVLSYTDKL